jgi:hypothetical protein
MSPPIAGLAPRGEPGIVGVEPVSGARQGSGPGLRQRVENQRWRASAAAAGHARKLRTTTLAIANPVFEGGVSVQTTGAAVPGGAILRGMIELALFIAFLAVMLVVRIGIWWYRTTGGRGKY